MVELLPVEIRSRIEVTPDGWRWTGSILKGYGQVKWQGRTRRAHRLVYELLIGPIPAGMHIGHPDHDADPSCPGGECWHRGIVGPPGQRTVPQTPRANVLAGKSRMAYGARQTHCSRCGLPLAGVNLITKPGGGRECRACALERVHRYRASKA